MKKQFIILTCALCYMLSAAPSAQAADVSLGVYPPIVQIDAIAPADIVSPITVVNLGEEPVHVTIQLRPFTNDPTNTGIAQMLSENAPLTGDDPQFLKRVELRDGDTLVKDLTLTAREQKDLTLHVAIPKNEPPSDYYFSIVYVSDSIGNDQSNFSSLINGVATNVLVSIGPKGPTTGSIENFSGPFFVQEGPVHFSVQIGNTSSHFIAPQGTILITDIFGKPIGKINLIPVNILEHSSRFIPSESMINNQLSIVNMPEAIWDEKFLLGIYQAKLSIALSQEGPLLHKTIYFFAFPFYGLFALFLAAILTGIIVYRVKKRIH